MAFLGGFGYKDLILHNSSNLQLLATFRTFFLNDYFAKLSLNSTSISTKDREYFYQDYCKIIQKLLSDYFKAT